MHYLKVLQVSVSAFLTEIVKLSSHPQVFDSVLLSSHSSLYYKMNIYSSMSSINTTQINYLKSFSVCLIQSQELHSILLTYHTCLIINNSMIMKPNLLHFHYSKLPKIFCCLFNSVSRVTFRSFIISHLANN